MEFDPTKDGIDHINIYSKANTDLGVFLSNFTTHPITTEDGNFNTVEGYWYWLKLENKNVDFDKKEKLRVLSGPDAKKLGRSLFGKDNGSKCNEEFKKKICKAIEIKILTSSFLEEFKSSILPFAHYYFMKGRVIVPKQGDDGESDWIVDFVSNFRNCIKGD